MDSEREEDGVLDGLAAECWFCRFCGLAWEGMAIELVLDVMFSAWLFLVLSGILVCVSLCCCCC
jgi:hypothetical protein